MVNTPDLSFKDDPGAVRHGNFINYYQFHGAQQRLNTFPEQIKDVLKKLITDSTQPLYALDLGCNSGEITQGLHKLLASYNVSDKLRILGVDIDPQLIKRAIAANEHCEDVQYMDRDLMATLANPEELHKFTNNSSFHLVTCLSITMWIHLNNGDAGLQSFLKHSAELSEVLVVEPQRWKSYKDAVRRMKRGAGIEDAFPYFKQLQWRETVEEDIQRYLESTDCNMDLIYRSNPSSWGRSISVYMKRRSGSNE